MSEHEGTALPWATAVELVSISTLLLNLATVHLPVIADVAGPIHGCAYLAVVVLAFTAAGTARAPAGWLAFVPVVGGLLALRSLRPTGRA